MKQVMCAIVGPYFLEPINFRASLMHRFHFHISIFLHFIRFQQNDRTEARCDQFYFVATANALDETSR